MDQTERKIVSNTPNTKTPQSRAEEKLELLKRLAPNNTLAINVALDFCTDLLASYAESDSLRSMSLDAWASSYQKENGHPPLVIGREYSYHGKWYSIVDANVDQSYVTLIDRLHEDGRIAEINELIWKKDYPTE